MLSISEIRERKDRIERLRKLEAELAPIWQEFFRKTTTLFIKYAEHPIEGTGFDIEIDKCLEMFRDANQEAVAHLRALGLRYNSGE